MHSLARLNLASLTVDINGSIHLATSRRGSKRGCPSCDIQSARYWISELSFRLATGGRPWGEYPWLLEVSAHISPILAPWVSDPRRKLARASHCCSPPDFENINHTGEAEPPRAQLHIQFSVHSILCASNEDARAVLAMLRVSFYLAGYSSAVSYGRREICSVIDQLVWEVDGYRTCAQSAPPLHCRVHNRAVG